MDVDVKLKATPSVIGSVADFSYKWSLNAGLTREDAWRVALAMDELVTNVVRFAFRDASADFEITYRRLPSKVEIIVHELGEPFHPDWHRYDPRRAVEEGDFEGAGFELIQHMADDFLFLNLGRQGKEFRVTKAISSPHIADLLPPEQLQEPDVEEAEDYTLHTVTPEDAEEISQLIYRSYGHSYVKEDLYHPRKTKIALEHGEKFGVIVRTPSGRAAGYFAVLRTTDSEIGEVGEAAVSVRHRRRGLMTRMLEALIEKSRKRGLLGLFGEAVTVHLISQKVNRKFGFRSTAMLLNHFPAMKYRALAEDYPQDVTIVIDFLPLVSVTRKAVAVPDRYQELLTDLYGALGIEVDFLDPSSPEPTAESELDIRIEYDFRHAVVVVERYGADFEEHMYRALSTLRANDLSVLYVDLPLEDPATPTVTPFLQELGFVLAGLMPLFHQEKDYLRLQKCYADLDLDRIEVLSGEAGAIKEMIGKELAWSTKRKAASSGSD